ncbi:unnamed protein product, partial [Discosporangium mesarthrocarpum]
GNKWGEADEGGEVMAFRSQNFQGDGVLYPSPASLRLSGQQGLSATSSQKRPPTHHAWEDHRPTISPVQSPHFQVGGVLRDTQGQDRVCMEAATNPDHWPDSLLRGHSHRFPPLCGMDGDEVGNGDLGLTVPGGQGELEGACPTDYAPVLSEGWKEGIMRGSRRTGMTPSPVSRVVHPVVSLPHFRARRLQWADRDWDDTGRLRLVEGNRSRADEEYEAGGGYPGTEALEERGRSSGSEHPLRASAPRRNLNEFAHGDHEKCLLTPDRNAGGDREGRNGAPLPLLRRPSRFSSRMCVSAEKRKVRSKKGRVGHGDWLPSVRESSMRSVVGGGKQGQMAQGKVVMEGGVSTDSLAGLFDYAFPEKRVEHKYRGRGGDKGQTGQVQGEVDNEGVIPFNDISSTSPGLEGLTEAQLLSGVKKKRGRDDQETNQVLPPTYRRQKLGVVVRRPPSPCFSFTSYGERDKEGSSDHGGQEREAGKGAGLVAEGLQGHEATREGETSTVVGHEGQERDTTNDANSFAPKSALEDMQIPVTGGGHEDAPAAKLAMAALLGAPFWEETKGEHSGTGRVDSNSRQGDSQEACHAEMTPGGEESAPWGVEKHVSSFPVLEHQGSPEIPPLALAVDSRVASPAHRAAPGARVGPHTSRDASEPAAKKTLNGNQSQFPVGADNCRGHADTSVGRELPMTQQGTKKDDVPFGEESLTSEQGIDKENTLSHGGSVAGKVDSTSRDCGSIIGGQTREEAGGWLGPGTRRGPGFDPSNLSVGDEELLLRDPAHYRPVGRKHMMEEVVTNASVLGKVRRGCRLGDDGRACGPEAGPATPDKDEQGELIEHKDPGHGLGKEVAEGRGEYSRRQSEQVSSTESENLQQAEGASASNGLLLLVDRGGEEEGVALKEGDDLKAEGPAGSSGGILGDKSNSANG